MIPLLNAGLIHILHEFFKVSKTTDNNSWNGEVRSTVGYTGGCYVTFSPNQNNKWFMMGLNTDPTTNTSYGTIDYQWYAFLL